MTPFAATAFAAPSGLCALLAQAEAAPVNPLVQFAPFALIAVMAYFIFVVPQKAKEKRFQQMIDGLKENDRVVTTGGLHGTVTGIQRDSGRMTLRVDDASGAKIRVSLWAIDSIEQANPPKTSG